jgi:hypothetical protein
MRADAKRRRGVEGCAPTPQSDGNNKIMYIQKLQMSITQEEGLHAVQGDVGVSSTPHLV